VGIEWGILPRLLRVLALVVAATAFARPALAGTQTASTAVTIVTPLSLVNTDSLRFGSIIPGASNGTVTVDPYTETRTSTGGVTLYGGAVTAAKFSGLSSNPSHLKIDVPAGSITLTRVGGTETMTANNFGINGDKNDWITSNTVFSFNVGARLTVGANQAAGTYVGTFTVTVNYR
jgi:hypothetical protein